MHKTLPVFLLVFILLILAPGAFARIIVVNNNVNNPGQYTKLQDALDAANDGDTLMIAGSPASYDGGSSLNIRKKLVLIGTGYLQNKEITQIAVVNHITFENGSSGTKLIGLYINGAINTGNSQTRVSDLVIERCYFNGWGGNRLSLHGMSNTVVRNCISVAWVSISESINVLMQNNIIFYVEEVMNSRDVLIRNNLFCAQTALYYGGGVSNTLFSNNIFYYASKTANTSELFVNLTNSVFINNIYFNHKENPFSIGENNNTGTGNIKADPQFFSYDYVLEVGDPPLVRNIVKDDLRLKPGSPAIGYGTDGKDVGIYGGAAPIEYPLTGAPPIPQIKSMTIKNNVVPPGGSLQVNVKATKGN